MICVIIVNEINKTTDMQNSITSTLKRLPTGIQTFEKIIEGDYVYIDKTALIYQLTHTCSYVFMSRPRRFGKSVLCSTLKSYFYHWHYEVLTSQHL